MPFFTPESAERQGGAAPRGPGERQARSAAAAFPDLPPDGELTQVARGMSASRVWRCASGGEAWAIRWTPRAVFDRERRSWTVRMLRQAREAGIRFLPAPIPATTGEYAVMADEGAWEASTWMPGEPLSTDASLAGQEAAVAALARFHRALGGEQPQVPLAQTPAFCQRVEALHGLVGRGEEPGRAEAPEIAALRRLVRSGAAPALHALEGVRQSPTRMHGVQVDSRPEHFLMTGDRVTGLVDFGAMRVDTPWVDLARLAGELARGEGAVRDRLVGRYESEAGRRVDPRAVAAIDFSGAVLASANWIRWIDEGTPVCASVGIRLAELGVRLARGVDRGGK